MAQTLGVVVATEKAARQRGNTEAGTYHKLAQKAEPLTGLQRTYAKMDDDGVDLPAEGKKVQSVIEGSGGLMAAFARALIPGLDLAATKDWANTQARSDVVVDGETILTNVPVTHLLFLEHQLEEVRTFFSGLTVQDPAENWTLNTSTGVYQSEPTHTVRFEQTEDPVVMYPATDKHPAQVKMGVKQTAAGTWTTVKLTGAIPVTTKAALVGRVNKLIDAVKVAREKANQVDAPKQSVGKELFTYLLGFEV